MRTGPAHAVEENKRDRGMEEAKLLSPVFQRIGAMNSSLAIALHLQLRSMLCTTSRRLDLYGMG